MERFGIFDFLEGLLPPQASDGKAVSAAKEASPERENAAKSSPDAPDAPPEKSSDKSNARKNDEENAFLDFLATHEKRMKNVRRE